VRLEHVHQLFRRGISASAKSFRAGKQARMRVHVNKGGHIGDKISYISNSMSIIFYPVFFVLPIFYTFKIEMLIINDL
jgi:hypothetical protein